jgi:uncharacterized protein YpmB
MSEILQIINIIVLTIILSVALYTLYKRDRAQKKKKADDEAEAQRWERGAEIASQNKKYMAFVNDFAGLGKDS